MSPLAFAVGAKSVSSRPIETDDAVAEFAEDGTLLTPLMSSTAASTSDTGAATRVVYLALALSDDQELQAIVTVTYYDMVWEDSQVQDCTIAAIRVQIVPAFEPMSLQRYRDSLHRIRLPVLGSSRYRYQEEEEDKKAMSGDCDFKQPSGRLRAVFSSDKRHLSCLVPYPSSTPDSVVVTFQLRRPRSDSIQPTKAAPPPPLPSYVHHHHHVDVASQSVPIATNPRVIRASTSSSSSFVSCVSDLENVAVAAESSSSSPSSASGPSILLAGCHDGSILAISYRPLVVAGSFFREDDEVITTTENREDRANSRCIRQLRHISDFRKKCSSKISNPDPPFADEDDGYDNDDDDDAGMTGRLVVLREDGSATIYRTLMVRLKNTGSGSSSDHYEDDDFLMSESERSRRGSFRVATAAAAAASSSSSSLYLSIKPIETISGDGNGPFVCAEWISCSYLALIKEHNRSDNNNNTTNYSRCDSNVQVQVWGLCTDGPSTALTSWEMTSHRLLENGHSSFIAGEGDLLSPQSICEEISYDSLGFSLQYDMLSDCLAISAVLREKSTKATGWSGGALLQRSFVCIWNWRCNVEGLLVAQAKPSSVTVPSCLSFAKAADGSRRIVHTIAVVESFCGGGCAPRLRKEIYDMSVLSMSSSSNSTATSRLQRASNLLVGSKTISFPVVTQVSTLDDFEVEWRDSRIPLDYIAARGAPRVAARGQSIGRSVAVASMHGLCILDCGEDVVAAANSSTRAQKLKRSESAFVSSRSKPRWHRFGSETEEGAFRVVAFSWWEGTCRSDDVDGSSDDILVAIIDVEDILARGRYLACWATKWLDFDHQLLVPNEDIIIRGGKQRGDDTSRYGIRIPSDFNPCFLDVLVEPDECGDSRPKRQRRATALVSDESSRTNFAVYQLQVVNLRTHPAKSYREMLPYVIQSKLASFCAVGSSSTVFLASASYAYDLENERRLEPDYPDYVATLGVVRGPGGGVDALAVADSRVIAVGEVVGPSARRTHSELSRFWLADFILGRPYGDDEVDCFAWLLEMASGALFCWSVPCVRELREADLRPFSDSYSITPGSGRLVQNACSILGITVSADKSSLWMQQPDMGARRVASLESVPRSCFGCVLGAEQICRKMHRSLGEAFEKQLFRPDFLEHETMTAGDFVISLPTFVPTLYALLVESTRTNRAPDAMVSCIHRHLQKRVRDSPYRDSSVMSLQLLVLRAVESIASSGQVVELLTNIVNALRQLYTPLQFATLFLDVGRQLEPSFLCHLFPLPVADADCTTVHDLFHLALGCGSITVAVAALPLFDDRHTLQSSCVSVFRRCLETVGDAVSNQDCLCFDFLLEERATIRDVFHYSLKLDDSGDDAEDDAESFSTKCSSDSIPESRGYSLMCGLSRLFQRRSKVEGEFLTSVPSSASDGFSLIKRDEIVENGSRGLFQYNDDLVAESGARIVARMLLDELLASSDTAPNVASWKKVAAFASFLLSGSCTGPFVCSAGRFSDHLRDTSYQQIESILPSDFRSRGGLVEFFAVSAQECDAALSSERASLLLDLFLILLGRHGMSDSLGLEVPGLLLLALVTGHHSGRTSYFVSSGTPVDHPVWTAYLEATFEFCTHSNSDK